MGDFLSEAVTDEFLERELLSAILSEAGKRHFWMLLTKRPKRLAELSKKWGGLPRNVMALTTVTNQRTADVRIPDLLSVQCYWRGISAEPLLEAITPWLRCELDTDGDGNCHVHRAGCPPKIDWISCGGESGANARWLSANSARGLRDQCQTAKVQFFFKQWGQYVPGTQLTEEVHRRIYGNAPGIEYQMWRVHKKDAGRLLDGREWNEMPEVTL
jgi:protein gp37